MAGYGPQVPPVPGDKLQEQVERDKLLKEYLGFTTPLHSVTLLKQGRFFYKFFYINFYCNVRKVNTVYRYANDDLKPLESKEYLYICIYIKNPLDLYPVRRFKRFIDKLIVKKIRCLKIAIISTCLTLEQN